MSIFKNKSILITGASSGIGLSFAQLLAKQGSNLILVARNQEQLEQIASGLSKKHGIEAYVIAADLAEPGAAQRIFAQTQKKNLSVDILINNAGFGKWGDFLQFDTATYSSMLQLNIITLTELCHLYLPHMLAKKEGGIINVSSTGGLLPVPYTAVYSASKAYVLTLSEALYGEYSKQGITVLALCPGGTKTNFSAVADSTVDMERSLASPDTVAQDALDAFLKRKSYVVSGWGNYFNILLTRFLPRKTTISLVGTSWKKIIDQKRRDL